MVTVVVDEAAVWPCTASIAVSVPATVPGSNAVGKSTVLVPAGTAKVMELGLLPKPVPNPASPLMPEGKPVADAPSATVSVPVKAAELVMVALEINAPGCGDEGRPLTLKVGGAVTAGVFVNANEAAVVTPVTVAFTA